MDHERQGEGGDSAPGGEGPGASPHWDWPWHLAVPPWALLLAALVVAGAGALGQTNPWNLVVVGWFDHVFVAGAACLGLTLWALVRAQRWRALRVAAGALVVVVGVCGLFVAHLFALGTPKVRSTQAFPIAGTDRRVVVRELDAIPGRVVDLIVVEAGSGLASRRATIGGERTELGREAKLTVGVDSVTIIRCRRHRVIRYDPETLEVTADDMVDATADRPPSRVDADLPIVPSPYFPADEPPCRP